MTSGILDFALESRIQKLQEARHTATRTGPVSDPPARPTSAGKVGDRTVNASTRRLQNMRALIVVGLILGISSSALAQTRRFVVAIGGIMHESNSFNPAKTMVSDFEGMRGTTTLTGADLLASLRKSNTEISGYLDGADAEKFDVYPAYVASATPKGPLTKDTFETLTQRLISSLKAAPKLDGILLALHGAMVADGFPQADEEIVRRVRAAFGPTIPIVVTHDFHGNPSPELVRPLHRARRRTSRIRTSIRASEDAAPAPSWREHSAAKSSPCRSSSSHRWSTTSSFRTPTPSLCCPSPEPPWTWSNTNPKILAVTVMGGYQYSDVPYMGPSVVVVTDNDRALAEKEAKRFGDLCSGRTAARSF